MQINATLTRNTRLFNGVLIEVIIRSVIVPIVSSVIVFSPWRVTPACSTALSSRSMVVVEAVVLEGVSYNVLCQVWCCVDLIEVSGRRLQ